jgi:peptidoglycan/LPS O-acetylase OafA/YrhL
LPAGRLRRNPDQAIATRDNSFDLLRLLACATVIFSHSYPLARSTDPLHGLFGVQVGTVGVFILFALSGYLLAASITHDDRLFPFWTKRALRLMPGMFVSVVLTALVLGPIVTTEPAHVYLTSAQPYLYVLKQTAFDTFNPHLPGVFVHNPFPVVVNGSLWTLPLEVCNYAALAFASFAGVLTRRWLLAVLGAVIVVMLVVVPPDSPHGVAPHGVELLANALRPCGCFACGVLLWLARERVPRTWWLFALALVAIVAPLPSGVRSALDVVAVPYAVAVVGPLRPGRMGRLLRFGDVSYGAYVYGFPIQQTIALLIPSITPGAMLAISAPLSWCAGVASWHLVERPALGLRHRILGTAARGAAGQPADGLTGEAP